MDQSQNHQELLAEQFFIDELTLNHDSYTAIMMIRHWKFILKIPGIGKRIIDDAGVNIRNSFFTFVSPSAILSEDPLQGQGSIN